MEYTDYLEVTKSKEFGTVLHIPLNTFSFGFAKALVITHHEQELRAFVESKGNSANNPKIVISEHNGKPVIHLPTASKYPLKMGLAKARTVLKYMPEICQFIVDNEADYLESQGFGRTEN